MPSIFQTLKSTCGCNVENKKVFIPNCYGLDLGLIYDNTTCYGDETPCEQTCLEEGYPPNSAIRCTEYPYGHISNSLQRMCAKLIVFKNARIVNEEFLHDDPVILFSRQRNKLPSFDECEINNPLHCPAENVVVACERVCNPPFDVDYGWHKYAIFYTGGNYLNIETEIIPTTLEYCTGCEGFEQTFLPEWKSNEYAFGFSPCEFESLSDVSNGGCGSVYENGQHYNKILAGYAINTNSTWLLDEEEAVYPIVKQAIIDNDPLGPFPHTVYLHYELKTILIYCHKGDKSKGYTDKDKREKAVAVQAALGFSCQLCGLDPDKACEKLYE